VEIKEKRRSRRYAIAFILGDLPEVSEYQPTRRGRVPIYMSESTDALLCALRAGEKAPEPEVFLWKHVGESYGYTILMSAQPE
jgi:hypothetical protein